MRGLAAITVFGLFLAVPVWAQRGGGGGHAGAFGGGHVGGFGSSHFGGGFGGHGGGFGGSHFGGFSGGHFSGGHSFARMRSLGTSRRFTHIPSARAGFSSRGPFMHDNFGPDRFRGGRFRNHHRFDFDNDFDDFGFNNHHRFDFDNDFDDFGFNNCWGWGCWGWGWGYPWWGWWDSGSNYDYDKEYERDRLLAEEMNQLNLQQQRMREEEEAQRDREAYARSTPAPAPQGEKEPAPVLPATVLVFRDQHKREIDNYAIVGQTLWAFSPHQTEKIPLADLDIAATAKANDDRGLTFRVPTANEAQ